MPKTMTDRVIRTAVRKQIRLIISTGFEPTWSLFSSTFGWFQIQQKLTDEEKSRYEMIWNEELPKIYPI